MSTRLVPGDLLAVVTENAVLLLAGGDPVTATAAWAVLAGGGGVPDVLHVLTSRSPDGFGGVPPFALVVRGGDTAQVVVRGELVVTGSVGGVDVQVDGTGFGTWTERLLDSVVEIGPATSATPDHDVTAALPVRDGVVRAGGVLLGVVPVLPVATDPGAGPAGPLTPVTPVPPVPATGSGVTLEQERADGSARVLPLRREPARAAAPVPAPAEATLPPEPLVTAVPPTATAAPAPRSTPPADADYVQLWGATVARTSEDAAVRAPEPEHDVVGPASASAGDHDGHTIARSALGLALGAPAPAPVAGPSVLSRVCPDGHANPPHLGGCRVCGAELAAESRRVPRPPLGRLRVSTGQRVDLDRTVVLGRAPSSSRVPAQELPRLVPVVAPEKDVSGSHLEVRLDGWHVLVLDLGSSNGSVLRRAGENPRRLGAEAVMARSGDVVEIGTGVDVTFEDLP